MNFEDAVIDGLVTLRQKATSPAYNQDNHSLEAIGDAVAALGTPGSSADVAAIKAKTDNLPSDPADQSAVEAAITNATSPLATSVDLATVDGIVDAIKAKTDSLAFAGTDVKATLDGEAVAVSDKTGFSLSSAYDSAKTAASQASVDTVDTVVDAIKAKTDNLPSNTTTTLSGIETKVDTVDTVVDAIKAKTDSLTFTNAGKVDATVQNKGVLNDISAADVNAQCDTALSDYDAPTKTEMDAAFTAIKGTGWTNETLKAIKDAIDGLSPSGGSSPPLFLIGACDSGMTASTTSIVSADFASLAGIGDDYFNNQWYLGVVKNANSVGAAPTGQFRLITDYASSTGTFTSEAFSANVEEGDSIVVAHRCLLDSVHKSATYTSGSGSWTCPDGVRLVTVLIVGGGGGGGGAKSTDGSQAQGGGGGGGAFGIFTNIVVVPGNSYTYTVGAGGAGGVGATPTNGGTGGTTKFANLAARGGGGGTTATNVRTGAGGFGGSIKGIDGVGAGIPATAVSYGGSFISGGGGGATGNSGNAGGATDLASGGANVGYSGGGGASFGPGASGVASGTSKDGISGTANTGAGGSGAYLSFTGNQNGGSGGSGYVLIIW